MRFSDLGRMPPPAARMGATVSASPTIPDASAAITSGQNTFNQAYSMAQGSLQGTAAVAAGIVAALPKGQLTTALNQAMGVAGSAEAGAAIGSVIPGYGTAIGAVVGAIVGIVSSITSSSPPNPLGEFRTASERYCFPALPLTPTVGESASALAQPVLQPVVWPTYRQNAVSWLPVQVDNNLGNPAPTQTKPITFSFGVGWVSPPSSTAASTQQGYYVACAWMSSNSVSRAHELPTDQGANGQGFASAVKESAITALGGTAAFNEATDLFRSWYGAGGWGTKVLPELAGNTWPPNNGAWSTPTKGYPAPQGYSGVWKSIHHTLREPAWSFDFTYYEMNYIVQTIGPNVAWSLDTVGASWMANQTHLRADVGWGAAFNIAPLPDTTAIALAELACLAVTGVIPRESADVAALHFLLGLAWMWRQGYELDKGRGKTIQQLYGIDTGIYLPTHDNFSRCIGIVAAKIRAAKKKAPKAKPKPKPKTQSPAVAHANASANASSYTAVQTHVAVQQQAAVAAVQKQAAAKSSDAQDLIVAGLVLAGATAAVVSLKKKRRRATYGY